MKNIILLVLLASLAYAQPTTPINNARFGGTNNVLSGASLNAVSGSTLAVASGATFTNANLTSGRVTFASTAGLLADSAAFTFNSGTGALINSSGGLSTLTLGGGDAGSYSRIILRGNATQNAWAVYCNNATSNALEFFPSTAGGGTTFSTASVIFNANAMVTMSGYGAGAATFDSSGNITSVSDARMKDIGSDFTTGLSAVRKLTPKFYRWNAASGLNRDDVNVSLIAQDLIAAGLPEAVFTQRTVADTETIVTNGKAETRQKKDADGKPLTKRIDTTYTVSDRAIIAALVNSIKELDARVTALEGKK